jgi:glycosyltransferase involved in cell wall biosynthesis
MRVGLIVDPIDEWYIHPNWRGGVYRYTSQLVRSLLSSGGDIRYTLIRQVRRQEREYAGAQQLVVPMYDLPLWHEIRKSILLPVVAGKEKLNVIHEPRGFIPHLFPRTMKTVLTVHDLTTILYPESHARINSFRMNLSLLSSFKRIDKIISVSENTKQDLLRIFHISDEKIVTIPLGVDEKFQPKTDSDGIKKKFGLPDLFILYIGSIEPRKNLSTLVKSFYALKKKGLKHKLVIAGPSGWKNAQLYDTITSLGLTNEIVFLGFVLDDDLPSLYSAAEVFVYPSLYEGFGLPPLEAMACGTPVVTSRASSIPQVVDAAALVVNPLNQGELAEAIKRVLEEEGLAEDLRKRGLKRAKEFSWQDAARKTIKVYEDLANDE